MKIAMIRVWRRLRSEKLKSIMVLQIHDELLIDTYKEEEEIVCRILREEMEHAADLSVDLIVELNTGADWYEAK